MCGMHKTQEDLGYKRIYMICDNIVDYYARIIHEFIPTNLFPHFLFMCSTK